MRHARHGDRRGFVGPILGARLDIVPARPSADVRPGRSPPARPHHVVQVRLIGELDLAYDSRIPRAPHAAGKKCPASLVQMVINVFHVGVAYLNRHGKKANSVGVEVVIPFRIIGPHLLSDPTYDMHLIFLFARYNPSGVGNFFIVGEFKDELLIRPLLERKIRHVENPVFSRCRQMHYSPDCLARRASVVPAIIY
jgi:hypothetical protein